MERARPDLRELFSLALARPAAERSGFAREACGHDPELYQQLVDLLHIDAELDAAGIVSPNALNDLSGTRVGAYELVREIGRGGMGAVYLGRRVDGSFERKVAVKVIAARRADPDLIARFEQERRLSASLDHPNIVRLLDAGNEDGRLYFVMEYIDGLPIHTYCEERRLTTRQRLGLFTTVCDAVAYAHRNLIVHRDLKPGNILVDASGTPKMLDFGIAKPITPSGLEDEESTDPLDKRMTFAYAAPEQRDGLPTHISMDVYALGVVLHKMLVGHVPHPLGSDDSAVTGVGAFPKPSHAAVQSGRSDVGQALEGDLDAIIMRALAPDRRERYESVEALRADVQRYLDHRPVAARRAGASYVARKFVRRNRVAIAIAAVVAIAAVTAVASLYASWRQAREERARADRRFAAVRMLARSLFSIEAQLGTLPGSTRPRRALVESASRYLDALQPEAGDYPELALDLAQGYRRLGDIQGNPNVANLGDLDAARKSYGVAVGLLTGLQERTPSDSVRLELAETYASQGDVLRAIGDTSGAMKAYQDALSIAKALRQTAPGDMRYQELESGLHRPIGDLLLAAGDSAGAAEHYRAALAIDTALHDAAPDKPEFHRLLALSEIRMAAVATALGDSSEARNALERAHALLEPMSAAGIGGASVQRELAVGDARIGSLLTGLGDGAGRTYLARAVEMFRKLSAADPADVRLRHDLASALVQYGDAVRGDSAANAQGLYAEARALVLRLPADDPDTRRLATVLGAKLPAEGLLPALARLQVSLLVGGRTVALEPGRPPAADTELLVAPVGPRTGPRYLLVFGAKGAPQILSEAQQSAGRWHVKAAGPPPAQTIMLIDAHRELSTADQQAIVDAIGTVPSDRIVDSDSVIAWTGGGDLDVQSAAAARGSATPKWIEAVRARLARVPGIAVTARTFPLAPRR